uniref:Uncharacterized protein n=1 Tax=Salmo trutta TaxID=8032 RepID=A0A674CFW8_SALTR
FHPVTQEYHILHNNNHDYQAASSSPDCPQCPQHILTGAEAAVSYSQFCETFGFHMGPSGARALLLFYELWGPSGTLVQRCQASNCLAQGQHPEPLLFDHQGNVDIVCVYCKALVCASPCCTVTTCRARSVLLDVPPSALQLPLLPERVEADRVNAIHISATTGIAYLHPINVVRHVRMPPPWRGQPQSPPSSSGFFSLLLSLRAPGHLVEIVREVEKEVRTAVSQSQHRDSKRGRRSRRK